MKRIHVIGRKNHGKTQLIVALIEEFTRRGLRVGTIKHTHHRHELDTPGKDSHRHRVAGAAAVGVLSKSMCAVFLPSEHWPVGQDRYGVMDPVFSGCDVLLVEGDTHAQAPKIEVWRSELGTPPIAGEDSTVLAVISDDSPDVDAEVLPRSKVPELASWILRRLEVARDG